MNEKEMLVIYQPFNEEDAKVYNKSFMFIKGVAINARLNQTLIALNVARQMHEGQHRKDGTPYFLHPLKVCTTLIGYGICDDVTLAASLLHDVLEDCQHKLPMGGKELVSEYGINHEVYEIVQLLTKKSGLNDYELSVYFNNIKKNPKALLIKLSDRLHNSQTLYTFSHNKLKKYIRETDLFLIPLSQYGKSHYPQYTNAFSILKNNIYSLNNSMKIITDIYDKQIENLTDIIKEKNVRINELEKENLILKNNSKKNLYK
jgi:GTP pyrophosphokinase